MLRKVLLLTILIFSMSAIAEDIECPTLKTNTSLVLHLLASESFDNCFSLPEFPVNTKVTIMSLSPDSVAHSVTVYEKSATGTLSELSTRVSNTDHVIGFHESISNDQLVLTVTPKSKVNDDKKLEVSLQYINGQGIMFLKLFNIDNEDNDSEPPIDGPSCRYEGGVRICDEIQ